MANLFFFMYYTEKIDAFIMKQTEITGFGGEYENISNWISKNWNIAGIKVCFGEVFQKGNRSRGTVETFAANLRKTHWETQKDAGIDYISGNDFSYYDMMLDTAVLFGIIPRRYQELGLSEMDTYFAMARGYQGPAGDVRALAMKKMV